MDTTPEVSEVLAELPWWVSRGLLYLLLAFVLTGIAWASLSKVDIVVEARGRITPEGETRIIQSTSSGIVQFVRISEGDTVSRGQVLFQLDTSDLHSRQAKLAEELSASEEQLRQLGASRGPVTETLERQSRIAQIRSEIANLDQMISRATITAPVSGTITRLDLKTPHAVVQAGQALASISPAGARLVVETQIPNKDIAFVEKGLTAKIKLDAFPFQDYGSLEGKVLEVAPDARFDEHLGSFYKATVLLNQASIMAHGRNIPLKAGLNSTVEIITERRSVLSLILEPFRKLKGEAGKLS